MMLYSAMLMSLSMLLMILTLMMMMKSMFIYIEIPLILLFTMNIPISILLDWLSCLFLSIVLFISSMIIMFSMFYIPKNEHNQFSILLLMFMSSMSILIISDNIIFILLGWDGLGLSSYILVIYYSNFNSAASGSITIFSNRIGDILIILTIGLLTMSMNWDFYMNEEFPIMCMIMIMLAACSKSAQFPFSAWLPAAMAAPTPISALVHSSTLVTAGVFLCIRTMHNVHPMTMFILLILSSITAIYASFSANWEQDMKKIIALSTLSQIAMMMFSISIGMILTAYFHMIIHALFKSTMFMCAGIMIHNSSYQDMRSMGSLFKNSPLTSSIMGTSNLTLMGLPFMSGFFSKDMILENLIFNKYNSMISMMMITSIMLTSLYSLRMMKYSTKFQLKSKPNININNNNVYSNLSISIMMPMSIFMGTTMLWLMPLQHYMILPLDLKMMIPLMMLMGVLLSMMLLHKSKIYIKLGNISIKMWMIHSISSTLFYPMLNLMNTHQKNDKTWQETYGPLGMSTHLFKMSKTPDMLLTIMLFMLLMMSMTPLMILM